MRTRSMHTEMLAYRSTEKNVASAAGLLDACTIDSSSLPPQLHAYVMSAILLDITDEHVSRSLRSRTI